MCVCVCTLVLACIVIREQLAGTGSPLPRSETWGLRNFRAWWQTLYLMTASPHQPCSISFSTVPRYLRMMDPALRRLKLDGCKCEANLILLSTALITSETQTKYNTVLIMPKYKI